MRREEYPLLGATHYRIPRGRRIGVLLRQELPKNRVCLDSTLAMHILDHMYARNMCTAKPSTEWRDTHQLFSGFGLSHCVCSINCREFYTATSTLYDHRLVLQMTLESNHVAALHTLSPAILACEARWTLITAGQGCVHSASQTHETPTRLVEGGPRARQAHDEPAMRWPRSAQQLEQVLPEQLRHLAHAQRRSERRCDTALVVRSNGLQAALHGRNCRTSLVKAAPNTAQR